MSLSHKILFFLNSLSIGILAPILVLVLCSHGASISSVSILIGIYSLSVVFFEIPSGIVSDLIGRKKTFIFSNIFLWATFFIILFSKSFAPLAIACAFFGIGTAFSSGTIEALEIEESLYNSGSLSKINNVLAILSSFGLAIGSLLGGWLGYIDSSYRICLLLLLALKTLLILLTIF